jgi:hypothetical protein
MQRRTLLQLVLALVTALPAKVRLFAQSAPSLSAGDEARIRAIGEVVLPAEIGPDGRTKAIDGFLSWLKDYRAGVDTDHGYGFTRLRRTAASPAAKYPAQLAALGADFLGVSTDARRRRIEEAIIAAKVERLPWRPDGGHIASDVMSFYFNSIEANDLAYRAAIGRDTCRGLAGSENRPAPLGGR